MCKGKWFIADFTVGAVPVQLNCCMFIVLLNVKWVTAA